MDYALVNAAFVQDIEGCMASTIGSYGISNQEFQEELSYCGRALTDFRLACQNKKIPALDMVQSMQSLEELVPIAEKISEKFRTVLVLGVGGSSLGGSALIDSLGVLASDNKRPDLRFVDNIDPESVEGLLATISLDTTFFLVISKSGKTLSTLAQFLIFCDLVASSFGRQVVPDHFIVVTEASANPLRRSAGRMGIRVLDHNPEIGGRFSIFSVAGLVPALIAGIDCRGLLDGAAVALETILSETPIETIEAARGAAVIAGLAKRRKIITNVMMPYSDRLRNFGFWYRQLVAESLGKDGEGILPVNAMGTVDQHSQLQLFIDGPPDKMVTFIGISSLEGSRLIPSSLLDGAEGPLFANISLGDLFEAEYMATIKPLTSAGRPTRKFALSSLGAENLGGLLTHFMVEVILLGGRFRVNPFDQPAVETGKKMARELLLNSH